MQEKNENISPKGGGNENQRLMSIREVSALTGVPPHTLRFWEKEMPEVLRPKRTPGGQRRYDSEMTERVRLIKSLANEGRCSLATIRGRLNPSQENSQLNPNLLRNLQAGQALELIVDEIAGLLKERLIHFLETSTNCSEGGSYRAS